MYTLIRIGVGHNKCTDQVHRSLSGQNASLPAATAGWGRTPRSSRRGGGWVPGLRLRLCTGVGGEGGGVGGGGWGGGQIGRNNISKTKISRFAIETEGWSKFDTYMYMYNACEQFILNSNQT